MNTVISVVIDIIKVLLVAILHAIVPGYLTLFSLSFFVCGVAGADKHEWVGVAGNFCAFGVCIAALIAYLRSSIKETGNYIREIFPVVRNGRPVGFVLMAMFVATTLFLQIEYHKNNPITTNAVGPNRSTVYERASAVCRDGTLSYSQNCSGTCSRHGGVAHWYNGCGR